MGSPKDKCGRFAFVLVVLLALTDRVFPEKANMYQTSARPNFISTESSEGCAVHYYPIGNSYVKQYLCTIESCRPGWDRMFHELKGPSIEGLSIALLPEPLTRTEDFSCEELGNEMFSNMPNLKLLGIYQFRLSNITAKLFTGLADLKIFCLLNYASLTFSKDWLWPLHGLWELQLNFNNIRSFPAGQLCGLTQLKVLNLSHNQFTRSEDFGIKCNPEIQNSSCLVCLPNVTNLDLSYNPFAVFDMAFIRDIPQLSSLNLSSSTLLELVNFESAAIIGLKELDLSNNKLISFTVEDIAKCNSSKLLKLLLQNNHLQYISPDLFRCTKHLKHLNLSGNHLAEDILIKAGFSDLSELSWLDLSYNNITTMQTTMFGNITDLVEFSCTGCGIRNIEKDTLLKLRTLKILRLNMNKLEFIDNNTFINQRKLTLLDLSENDLFTFELSSALPDLTNLNLTKNVLQHTPKFGGPCYQLAELDLSRNNISYISKPDLWYAPSIKMLDLSNNIIWKIDYLAFDHLGELRHLNLDFNLMLVIPKSVSFIGFHYLHMRGNLIQSIMKADFGIGLQWVDLSQNHISQIGNYSFDWPNLHFVNLTYNRLRSLTMESFSTKMTSGSKTQVFLEGNSLLCDCSTIWIKITASEIYV